MSLWMKWLESLSHEIIAADHCLRKISPFSTCTSCVDSCETQAISFENGIPMVNNQNCNLCGRCVTVCPVVALEGQSPSRKVVNKVLILEDGPTPTVNELLFMYKNEIRTISISSPNQKVDQIIKETNSQLMGMNHLPFDIRNDHESVKLQAKKLSRRDFFNKLSSDSKKLAATTVTPAKWRFNHAKFKMTNLYPNWAFFAIEFRKEQCTLCEACFRLCPENVFSNDGEQLTITAVNCTGCSLCVDVCRYQGIKIKQEIRESAAECITIHNTNCKTCGDPFYSWEEEDNCFICKSKEANSILNFL
ncbi:4Fe-4S dicluster domain-containing protein [Neobacillus niacini]|uniref:4Fe-4S dicluster domain-containing protein n=1 Tax=Neobacillus niacini TaxID=86668 RepID=UPI0021CB1A15|nr:4Fe-4S dicluster domain-containing protein [Neobacillus niacini]MCM3765490.1 4Fe-4S binding protein [Neobacillus niacini]